MALEPKIATSGGKKTCYCKRGDKIVSEQVVKSDEQCAKICAGQGKTSGNFTLNSALRKLW